MNHIHIYPFLFFSPGDYCHELLDHVPIFTDKQFTQFPWGIILLFFTYTVLLISLEISGEGFLGEGRFCYYISLGNNCLSSLWQDLLEDLRSHHMLWSISRGTTWEIKLHDSRMRDPVFRWKPEHCKTDFEIFWLKLSKEIPEFKCFSEVTLSSRSPTYQSSLMLQMHKQRHTQVQLGEVIRFPGNNFWRDTSCVLDDHHPALGPLSVSGLSSPLHPGKSHPLWFPSHKEERLHLECIFFGFSQHIQQKLKFYSTIRIVKTNFIPIRG